MEAKRADLAFRLNPEEVSVHSGHPKGCREVGVSSGRCFSMRSSYLGVGLRGRLIQTIGNS